jgi:hypothetical protein
MAVLVPGAQAALSENRTRGYYNFFTDCTGLEPNLNAELHWVYGNFYDDFTPGSLVAPKRTANIAEGKFDYLFGKAKGTKNAAHNLPRTNQNAMQMKRLGVPDTAEGHSMLRSHLDDVIQSDSNIARSFQNKYGSYEVRESLFSGPSGKFSKLESTWEIMSDGSRRLTTVIPYGGR